MHKGLFIEIDFQDANSELSVRNEKNGHASANKIAEERKRCLPAVEELDMLKWRFAEYIVMKTSDFMRQSNFNSIRAFASAAERGIIFISFRTSEIISPIVPSRPLRLLQHYSRCRPRSLGRGLYGIASVRLSHELGIGQVNESFPRQFRVIIEQITAPLGQKTMRVYAWTGAY